MQLNGEHTPPACGLRRLATIFVSPSLPNRTVGRDGGTRPTAGRRSAARETRALPKTNCLVPDQPRFFLNFQAEFNMSWS
jgi:hypothetical protein